MPRVKIDYIVSFSSEDPDNQASNLLAWEVGKKKWLCGGGEASCSVVLQLTRAVQISAVHIGAHNAAFVEVLVGRSEKPNEDFQVLVPKSVFVSPAEWRRSAAAGGGAAAERVRSFPAPQLLAPARAQRWDRARLVCSQPHYKHCQYGLSFVHIYEPEGAAPASAAPAGAAPAGAAPAGAAPAGAAPAGAAPASTQPQPARPLALGSLSSDEEEEFKPGELFAKHLHKPAPTLTPHTQSNTSNTGVQIRQATSQALKNLSDSAAKLIKTPLATTVNKRQRHEQAAERAARAAGAGLLYTDDDERPHAAIDRVLQRHHDQKNKGHANQTTDKNEQSNKHEEDVRDSRKELNKDDKRDSRKDRDGHSSTKPSNSKNTQKVTNEHRKQRDDHKASRGAHSSKNNDSTGNNSNENESRKRPRSDTERNTEELASAEPHTLLRGVVLVLSGYQNPRRAALRRAALALGARVRQDWGPDCTHLICAFPNTPKLRALRAAGGGAAPAARGEWLQRCAAARRRLPWRWFATEPAQRTRPPDHDHDHDEREHERERVRRDVEPDCDTDEEIERVLRNRKKHKTDESPRRSRDESPAPRDESPDPRNQSPFPRRLRDESPGPQRSWDESPGPRDESPDPPSADKRDAAHRDCQSPKHKINSRQTNSDAKLRRPSRYSIETVVPEPEPERERGAGASALPDFFDGYTFLIAEPAPGDRLDVQLLKRYVRAYGGVIVKASQLDEDSEVNFVICSTRRGAGARLAAGACAVRPDWVWRCHAARDKLPHEHFAVA